MMAQMIVMTVLDSIKTVLWTMMWVITGFHSMVVSKMWPWRVIWSQWQACEMNWDAQISINTQTQIFSLLQSCLLPYYSYFPGRKKNQRNPVVDEQRFTKDRSRNGNTYYKCTLFKDGCRARIFPSRGSVHRFGIQYESEFSAQIFLTKIGIQCWSEFRPSRNSVREEKPHTDI